VKGQSNVASNLMRESFVSLKIYREDGSSLESANHAGVHLWPTNPDPVPPPHEYTYGGLKWYRWGLDPITPEDIFNLRPQGYNFEVRLRYRNDYTTASSATITIDEVELRFQFWRNTPAVETITLAPTSVITEDTGSDWIDPDNLVNRVDTTCDPTPACLETDTIVARFGNIPATSVDLHVVTTKAQASNWTSGYLRRRSGRYEYCYKFLTATKRSPIRNNRIFELENCEASDCKCSCGEAFTQPQRCVCEACAPGGDPDYLGPDGHVPDRDGERALRYPVRTDQTLITAGGDNSWTVYFWFKPFKLGDQFIFWQGLHCTNIALNPDLATHLEIFQLNQFTLDVIDDLGLRNSVDLTPNPGEFDVDTWHFFAATYDGGTNTALFKYNTHTGTVVLGGTECRLSVSPLSDWALAGHTGRAFTLDDNSFDDRGTSIGCFDGYTTLTIPKTAEELEIIRDTGCPT
jgi:hypothetical protein